MTAEIGSMRISEEIDATESIGLQAIPFVVGPRLIGSMLVVLPGYLMALVVAFVTGGVVVKTFHDQPSGTYDHYFAQFLNLPDLAASVVKALIFCAVVTMIHCYYGYFASGGPAGVGSASGRAIRASLVAIVVLNFVMTVIIWGLSPELVFKDEEESMSRSQDFLRGTAAEQSRRLAAAGAAAIVFVGVAGLAAATLYPKITAPDGIELVVDVPYLGPGVAEGTKVVLHGQSVGRVTALERTPSESVQVRMMLDESQIDGLTDRFEIDYRPENYFGTSAVNILARPGGGPLESGMELERTPEGDFTMSTMIEQGSLTIDGTLTDDMITSLDKTVHYLDGLTPWVDTGVFLADRVAETQQEMPSTLLARFNDILEAFPGFGDQAIESLMNIYHSNYNTLPDGSVGVDDASSTRRTPASPWRRTSCSVRRVRCSLRTGRS